MIMRNAYTFLLVVIVWLAISSGRIVTGFVIVTPLATPLHAMSLAAAMPFSSDDLNFGASLTPTSSSGGVSTASSFSIDGMSSEVVLGAGGILVIALLVGVALAIVGKSDGDALSSSSSSSSSTTAEKEPDPIDVSIPYQAAAVLAFCSMTNTKAPTTTKDFDKDYQAIIQSSPNYADFEKLYLEQCVAQVTLKAKQRKLQAFIASVESSL